MVCITLLCVQPIPILSAFFLCHPYTIPLSNFSFTCPLSFMLSNDSRGYSRFVHMCVTDSIVSKCVTVKD